MSARGASRSSLTLPPRDAAARRERTREDVLDATEELLAEGNRLTELSIGRIVERAGISRPTFYTHFADKRELVAGLMDRHTAPLRAVASVVAGASELDRDGLRELVGTAAAVWRENSTVLGAMIELAAYDDEAAAAWSSFLDDIATEAATVLRRTRGSEVDERQAEVLGRVIVLMAERSLSQILGRESGERLADEVSDALTDVLWRTFRLQG